MKRRSIFAVPALLLGLVGASKTSAQPTTLSLRTIKIYVEGACYKVGEVEDRGPPSRWVDAEWKDIKKGTCFRLFESTGALLVEVADRAVPTMYSAWIATADAQPLPKEQGSFCVSVVGAPGYVVL